MQTPAAAECPSSPFSAAINALAMLLDSAELTPRERLRLTGQLAAVKKDVAAATSPMAKLRLAGKLAELRNALLGVAKKPEPAPEPEVQPEPPATPEEVAEAEVEAIVAGASERESTADFFDFDDARKQSQRKRDNAAVFALLAELKSSGRPATPEEKRLLAKYSGTGGGLTGNDGRRGSDYEYYTPKPIAEGVWGLLNEMGFGGGRVLDPAGGTGIFGATAPVNSAIDAVELSPVSADVNRLVNDGPGYRTVNAPFERVASATPDETYDAVVTNVPFGDNKARGGNQVLDDRYQREPLENYFILRSLEKLRPGGLAAFIAPPRCVSGRGGPESSLRVRVSYMAEFMGAYRLPNSVFGTAAADTMSDVIIFRKYSREVLDKIEELKEQNPQALVDAKVVWDEFVSGQYFKGEGLRFVIGDYIKVRNRFGDMVDALSSPLSIADIGKLLRKLPASRVDFAALNAAETQPIVYNEGDTVSHAGTVMEMRNGRLVVLRSEGAAEREGLIAGILSRIATPLGAVNAGIPWGEAFAFWGEMRDTARGLDLPDWFRGLVAHLVALPEDKRSSSWDVAVVGLAMDDVMREQQGEAVGFNYLEGYPALSEAMKRNVGKVGTAPSSLPQKTKTAIRKVAIHYDKANGFSAVWRGDVVQPKDNRDMAAKFEAQRYALGGKQFMTLEDARNIYGADFDPTDDTEWCVSGDGKSVAKASDYYVGNYAEFLARIDAEIAAATDPDLVRKLTSQRRIADSRAPKTDVKSLTMTMNSPFVTIEERVEFLSRFVDKGFRIEVVEATGEQRIEYVGASGQKDSDLSKMYGRLARHFDGMSISRGGIKTSMTDREVMARMRQIAADVQAQFGTWAKSNPAIMARLHELANDPNRRYFKGGEDTSPLIVPGLNPNWEARGFQNSFIRRMGREFAGINGYAPGLGKTSTSLIAVQHIQSIGAKRRTMFVLPNSVISNWRKEAARVYATTDDCLYVGLREVKPGKFDVAPKFYDQDLTRILEGRFPKIFVTYEAFMRLRLKQSTAELYDAFLAKVDAAYAASDVASEDEASKSDRAELIAMLTSDSSKSAAAPYFEDLGVDSLVFDEAHMCFPAGTLVDGRPIESLAVGDMVTSWNHRTLQFERKPVLVTMRRPVERLVRVQISDGTSIACTPSHPFYIVGKGYISAEFLKKGLPVAINRSKSYDSVEMQAVHEGFQPQSRSRVEAQNGKGGRVLLQQVVPSQVHREYAHVQGKDVIAGAGAENARGAAEERQLAADARGGGQEQGRSQGSRLRPGQAALSSGRQWPAFAVAASDAGGCAVLDARVCDSNEAAPWQRLPDLLQGRLGPPGNQDGDRGGWAQPPGRGGEGPGCEEDGVPEFAWVESVGALEPGSDGRFGGVCPDGYVYDITVEDNHNFFAEGVLVHNCKNSVKLIEFKGAKGLAKPKPSARGIDAQAKAWYVRKDAPRKDGVLLLSATSITNSPAEVYAMLALANGHERVNDAMLGIKGADQFMNMVCETEEKDEESIDGVLNGYTVFVGLTNTKAMRSAIEASSTIVDAGDVGEQIVMPRAEEAPTPVPLPQAVMDTLQEYKAAFRWAIDDMYEKVPNRGDFDAFERVSAQFGEPQELIAHPFNMLNKMSALIADPELSRRATFYTFGPVDAEKVAALVEKWNKKPPIEDRARPGPETQELAILPGVKKVKSGDKMVEMRRIQVRAYIKGDRVVLDTMDSSTIEDFDDLADKSGINFDVTIPPKLAAMLENFKLEEANPRGVIDGKRLTRVRQLIFCDTLAMHGKIKRILQKHAGVSPSVIAVVTGKSNNKPEEILAVQDGFNAEGENNRYRVIIANEKAEVGINLQKGTQAIHHVTNHSYTPDALTQRNGRGVRQGNETPNVRIYHYDADGTFDTYRRGIVGKKAAWIETLLGDSGSNSVRIAGGLTAEQEEMLINSVGDSQAMARMEAENEAIQQRAYESSVRGKQTVALTTVRARQKFLNAYPTAAAWAGDKVAQYVNMLQVMTSLQERIDNPKATASAVLKNTANLAILQGKSKRMRAELDESLLLQEKVTVFREEKLIPATLEKLIQEIKNKGYIPKEQKGLTLGERVGLAIKHGEFGWTFTVDESGVIGNEWEAEVEMAKAMIDEGKAEFARLAGEPGGASASLVEADDKATFLVDGQMVCVGALVEHDGLVGYMTDDSLKRVMFVNEQAGIKRTTLQDIIRKATVVLPGQPGYEAMAERAAKIEDAIADISNSESRSLSADNKDILFSSHIPEVARLVSKPMRLKYTDANMWALPEPYFSTPLNPKDISEDSRVLREIANAQAAVITWLPELRSGFTASSRLAVRRIQDYPSRGKELIDYAMSRGLKFTSAEIEKSSYLALSMFVERDAAGPIEAALSEANSTDDLMTKARAWIDAAYPLVEVPATDVDSTEGIKAFLRNGSNFDASRKFEAALQKILNPPPVIDAQAIAESMKKLQAVEVEPAVPAEEEKPTDRVLVAGDTKLWYKQLKEYCERSNLGLARFMKFGGAPVDGVRTPVWQVLRSQWQGFLDENPTAARDLHLTKP